MFTVHCTWTGLRVSALEELSEGNTQSMIRGFSTDFLLSTEDGLPSHSDPSCEWMASIFAVSSFICHLLGVIFMRRTGQSSNCLSHLDSTRNRPLLAIGLVNCEGEWALALIGICHNKDDSSVWLLEFLLNAIFTSHCVIYCEDVIYSEFVTAITDGTKL